MAPAEGDHHVLPKDLMELQLGQIDLLLAMYESDNAISIPDTDSALLNSMRSWCEGDEDTPPRMTDTSISLLLHVTLDNGQDDDSPSPIKRSLALDLSVPLVSDPTSTYEAAPPLEPPRVKFRIRKPAWMNKAEAARLTDGIPDEDDILAVIEHFKEEASLSVPSSREKDMSTSIEDTLPLVRVWFYFPSISTRSKRDDLINHAPSYGLTGFLLAGKPGILCLEGDSQAIDDYMRFIKTESWGDIPPQHKKVSERYREAGSGLDRVFKGMQEITHMIGERRGERANRNDMKALEAWLEGNGISPDVFGEVLM